MIILCAFYSIYLTSSVKIPRHSNFNVWQCFLHNLAGKFFFIIHFWYREGSPECRARLSRVYIYLFKLTYVQLAVGCPPFFLSGSYVSHATKHTPPNVECALPKYAKSWHSVSLGSRVAHRSGFAKVLLCFVNSDTNSNVTWSEIKQLL